MISQPCAQRIAGLDGKSSVVGRKAGEVGRVDGWPCEVKIRDGSADIRLQRDSLCSQ